jgi:peptide/nickel transport system ATP-binding protein
MKAMIEVRGLRVCAIDPSGARNEIVHGVDFSVARGEVLALIGESGSGKTTIALALLGHARSGCAISGGSVHIGEIDVLALDARGRQALRARTVAYIAQSASSGFNPARTIMDQVIEPALLHKLLKPAAARAKAVELFRSLALPQPECIGERYPHQVSGGQLQRLMAAMALITDPAVVVFDEPTTALDVTTQIEVLAAFKQAVRERNTTAVYVSHDLAVVAQMADRIVVLNGGSVREVGPTLQILDAPADDYTRQLLKAASERTTPEIRVVDAAAYPSDVSPRAADRDRADTPLLEIRQMTAGYGAIDRQGLPAIRVLDDVSLSIRRGSALGVIGESGSGKTTLARVLAGPVPLARGSMRFNGEVLPSGFNQRTAEQFRQIQLVFQNADTALNPSHSIDAILRRPLRFYHSMSAAAASRRIAELLDLVRLPASVASRRAGELSGGQKQRVNLARALAADPALILCDEVTSALDTVVAAAILDLLVDLRRELGVSYLFISHDIGTVRALCDDVVVLYAGHRVETGQRDSLTAPPYHPYTELLVDSVPALRPGWLDARCARAGTALPAIGEVEPIPELCSFLERCPVRIDGLCNRTPPAEKVLDCGTRIVCHHTLERLTQMQHDAAAATAATETEVA